MHEYSLRDKPCERCAFKTLGIKISGLFKHIIFNRCVPHFLITLRNGKNGERYPEQSCSGRRSDIRLVRIIRLFC